MNTEPIGFLRVKVVALPVTDTARAHHFYGGTLGLRPAHEDGDLVGYWLGDTIAMLKADWDQRPSAQPNPRLTLEVESATGTEQALLNRGVTVSDPVQRYGSSLVGGFLDSEGNKWWFCGPAVAGT